VGLITFAALDDSLSAAGPRLADDHGPAATFTAPGFIPLVPALVATTRLVPVVDANATRTNLDARDWLRRHVTWQRNGKQHNGGTSESEYAE